MFLFIVIVIVLVVVYFLKVNNDYKKEFDSFMEEKGLRLIETKTDDNMLAYMLNEKDCIRLEKLFNTTDDYNLDKLLLEIADKKQHNPHFMAVYDTIEDYKNQLVAKKYFKGWGIEFTETKNYLDGIDYEATDDSIKRIEELYNTNKIFKNENEKDETLEGSVPSSVVNSPYVKSMMLEIRSQCDVIKENHDEEEFKKKNKKIFKDAIRSGGLFFNKDSKYFYCMTYTDFKIKEKLEDIVAVGIENRSREVLDKNSSMYVPHTLKEPTKPVLNYWGIEGNSFQKELAHEEFDKKLAEYQAELLYVKQHNDEEWRRHSESLKSTTKTENYEVVVVVTKDTTVELPIETKHVLKSLLPDKVQY